MFTVLRSLTKCLGFGRLHVLGPAADRRFVRSSGRRPVLGPPAGPRGPAERQTTCLVFGPVRRPAVPGRSGRRSCCFFGSSPATAHGRSCSLVSRSCFLLYCRHSRSEYSWIRYDYHIVLLFIFISVRFRARVGGLGVYPHPKTSCLQLDQYIDP